MSRRKSDGRVLNRIARDVLHCHLEPWELPPDDELEDIIISLVRQWTTYDGHAMFFSGEQPVYLVLKTDRSRKRTVLVDRGRPGSLRRFCEDWSISPEDLPAAIAGLNAGQSPEVVNEDGIPMRFWVNPKERSTSVEPLVEVPVSRGRKRDHRKIAANTLKDQLGTALPREEIRALAGSVARQWRSYEGNACLFLDGAQKLVLTLTELDDGGCNVRAGRRKSRLRSLLARLGFAPVDIPDVIVHLNLGQDVEFRDRNGARSILWYDPKAGRLRVRAVKPVSKAREVHRSMPPLLCPKCSAVLDVWQGFERSRTCPLCGYTV